MTRSLTPEPTQSATTHPRKLQHDYAFAGKLAQQDFSKTFDRCAPLGFCLVAADLSHGQKTARLTTIVHGTVQHDELVDDLLFDCAYLVSWLTQGAPWL